MDVLQKSGASSYAVYSAYVDIKNNIPISGDEFWVKNFKKLRSDDSDIVNKVFKESFEIPFFKDSFFISPKAIGSASYFGKIKDREHESNLIKSNTMQFPEKVFKKLDDSWAQEVSGMSVGLNIRIGPFLSIVLSRANNRSDIPKVVLELREELVKNRKELWELYDLLLTEKRSAVAVKNIQKLDQAIQNIIPACFQKKERPFSLLWNTSFAVGNFLAGNPLPILKYAGDFLLNKDKSFSHVSTIGITKKLTKEIKSIDESLINQLHRHLSLAELNKLGLMN
jgi:hypothetical protein